MAGSLWASALLWILLVHGVASDCGSSFLLVDPCNEGHSVHVKVCVQVGTSLTVACNIQDSAAAWLGPNFENPAFISSSVSMITWLNGMVDLKFINQTLTCILSSATIDNVQQSVDELDLFCRTHVPGRSGANISIIAIGDAITSVKQIGIDLTAEEMHVDLEFFDDQDCQFYKYLISEGSCSQQDDSTTVAILEPPTMQRRIKVKSFSELCVSACTEEEVCTCQEIDLDGFTVSHSQELSEETSYSVLLSFSHAVLIESVGVSPQGNRANCNANNETSQRVILSCSDLSNDTTYSVTVLGNASLNNIDSGFRYSDFAVSLGFSTTARMNNETVQENGLSAGAIAGIVLSVFFVLVLIDLVLIGLFLLWVKFRPKTKWIGKEDTKETNTTTVPSGQGLEDTKETNMTTVPSGQGLEDTKETNMTTVPSGQADIHVEDPDSPGSLDKSVELQKELSKKRSLLNKVKKVNKDLEREVSAGGKMEHKLEKEIEELEKEGQEGDS